MQYSVQLNKVHILTGALPVRNNSYGDSSGPVISGINCTGAETTLFECTWETKINCNPRGRSAGAICQGRLQEYELLTLGSSLIHALHYKDITLYINLSFA